MDVQIILNVDIYRTAGSRVMPTLEKEKQVHPIVTNLSFYFSWLLVKPFTINLLLFARKVDRIRQ